MKKKFLTGVITCVLCFLMIVICGCGEDQRVQKPVEDEEVRTQALEMMEGAWECEDNPLGVPDCYVGYLCLQISSDGTFAMYDTEAGNPSITGRFLFLEDGIVQLHQVNRADFNPPPLWESMEYDEVLAYRMKSETKLLLSYTDPETDEKMTLIFDKVKK